MIFGVGHGFLLAAVSCRTIGDQAEYRWRWPLRLSQSFRPVSRADGAALSQWTGEQRRPHIPMSAGPATLAIAVAGLGLSIARLRRVGWVGFYAIAASALLWLVTPGSQWVWEHLPGLRFYQFPWRFLGPLATCLVPLVSMLGTPLNSPRARRCSSVAGVRVAIAALVALSLLVPALVGLYPLPWTSGFEAILPPDIIRAELAGRWRGTTSTNDFVPATVAMIPGPQQSVLESYEHPPVDRVNRATLP